MDIPQLIKEAKHGSAAAQKCLFDKFARSLLTVCRRYVRVKEDAEEMLLNGFYKFFKSLDTFSYRDEASLYMWLKTIMVNECLMFLRKKKVLQMVPETTAEDIPLQEDILNRLTMKEIINMIVKLPVGYRTVFNLFTIEGMSHEEIARHLGISEGTSKSQLSRAKSLLQKLLIENENSYENRKQYK